jgi:hypothetical protein
MIEGTTPEGNVVLVLEPGEAAIVFKEPPHFSIRATNPDLSDDPTNLPMAVMIYEMIVGGDLEFLELIKRRRQTTCQLSTRQQ